MATFEAHRAETERMLRKPRHPGRYMGEHLNASQWSKITESEML